MTSETFTHGPDFSARVTAAGFVWRSAGENIATGFPIPETVVKAWMASTDHCQNILNPTYSDVGTGVNRRSVKPYGLAPGTWTQAFGLPKGANADNWASYRGCPYTYAETDGTARGSSQGGSPRSIGPRVQDRRPGLREMTR